MSEVNYYNIYTGKSDMKKMGLLHSWNYKTSCGVYEGECDIVKGSVGDLWPINGADEDKARLFISDFCRFVERYSSFSSRSILSALISM